MTKEEITEKGRKLIRTYINSCLKEYTKDLSAENKKIMFSCIESVYKENMRDFKYYDRMEDFLTRRKPAAEKEEFCYNVMNEIVTDPKFKKLLHETTLSNA